MAVLSDNRAASRLAQEASLLHTRRVEGVARRQALGRGLGVGVALCAVLTAAAGGCGNSTGSNSQTAPTVPATTDAPGCGDQPGRPSAVSFWSDERGLVGFENGHNQSGGVYLTKDGGETFEQVAAPCASVAFIDTAGRKDAWVTLAAADGSVSATESILHTEDGGRTWNELPTVPVTAPSFGTRKDGMATGSRRARHGRVDAIRSVRAFATHDGGETWQAMPYPCSAQEAQNDYDRALISMPLAETAWALCIRGAGAFDDTSLFRTDDGGATWEQVLQPELDGDPLTLSHVEHLSFERDGNGLITGPDFMYRTRDGGMTVNPFRIKAPGGRFRSAATDLQQRTPDHTLVLIEPRLFESHDGGHTWKVVYAFRR